MLAAVVAFVAAGCATADPEVLAAQDRCAEAENGAASQDIFEACTLVIERGGNKREVAFAFNRRGMLHRRAGRDSDALKDFDEAVRLEPYYSGAYNNRANIYGARGDARAEQSYLTAIQTKPDNAMAHNNYAWYLATQGRYDEALTSVNRAVALKDNSDAICDTQAHVLMGLGQAEEAQAAFDCAMTIGGAEVVKGYQLNLIAKSYAPGRTDGLVDDATRAALAACIRDNCRLMLE